MDKIEFVNGERYHIFNRGVEKRDVFMGNQDYRRFLLSMREFNTQKRIGSLKDLKTIQQTSPPRAGNPALGGLALVKIIAYCLNPNHYHFILEQQVDGGISKFMQKLGSGYTQYFNKCYSRSGVLFQGKFKSVHIETNEYLLYLSVYVNANNFIHGYKDNKNWLYSSWLDYSGKRGGDLCDKSIVLDQFGGDRNKYKKFAEMNAEHLKDKKMLEKCLLEED